MKSAPNHYEALNLLRQRPDSADPVIEQCLKVEDNYFMHLPFNEWYRSIIDMIYYLHRANEPSKTITDAMNKHPLKKGWDEDSKQFVQSAMRIAQKHH